MSQLDSMLQPCEVRMMLITGGDLRAMEETAVSVYTAGHIPVLCEWLSYPIVSIGNAPRDQEETFTELLHPIAERLLGRCDAVLRVDGRAAAADMLVALARARGISVYESLQDALAG
jgi:hypothetical protein